MSSSGRPMALALLLLVLPACGEQQPSGAVVLTHGLEQQWKLLPHRHSRVELRLLPPAAGLSWRVASRNDGGAFGLIDSATSRLHHTLLTGHGFAAVHGELTVRIPAGKTTQTRAVSLPDAPLALEDAGWEAVPLLRGFELSSNSYTSPPAWSDRYDPAQGFTSAGLGVQLGGAARTAGSVTFNVTVANRPSPCDRHDASKKDDMNGVIPLADTWITVHYTVLALPRGRATAGELTTFVNYPTFASDGKHVSIPLLAQRTITIQGRPGQPGALAALQGFDLLSNDAQKKDPACPVKQAPTCKGPGRYIRSLAARAELLSHDRSSGQARVAFHLRLDNDAPDGFKAFEAGTMCVRATGRAVLIQPGGEATVHGPLTTEVSGLQSGVRTVVELVQGGSRR